MIDNRNNNGSYGDSIFCFLDVSVLPKHFSALHEVQILVAACHLSAIKSD